jgi:hypothetical protein
MPKPDAIKPLARTKHIFLCVYGDSGVGKTRLIGTAENPTLILRPPTEHTDSIKTPENCEEWIVHDWDEMSEVEEFLRLEGGKHYVWVWLDSISAWQDIGLDHIWENLIAAKPHRKGTPIDRGEYNQNFTRLSRWVRSIVGIDEFNFGITAHPMEMEIPTSGEIKLQPFVQGKNMTTKVQGYMNVVAYYEKTTRKKPGGKDDEREVVRVLRTEDHENYVAKDQFDAFPKGRLINPTLPQIEAAIASARPKTTVTRRKTATKRPARRRVAK